MQSLAWSPWLSIIKSTLIIFYLKLIFLFSWVSSKFYFVILVIQIKSHKLSFGISTLDGHGSLDFMYAYVWGTLICSMDGLSYYVIFVDHFMKYSWVYSMTHKYYIFSFFFSKFKIMIEIFFKSINIFRY